MSDLRQRLRVLAEPLALQLGFELVEVQFVKEGSTWVLRFLLDKPGGINIDDCERFSRQIESILDTNDPIPHQYTLEVSSAGLDRPLLKEADYIRFSGHDITVRLYQPIEGRRQFTARLAGLAHDAGEAMVSLEIMGNGEITVPLAKIARAKLVPDL